MMYDLLIIGNPVSLPAEGTNIGEVVLGPSVVAASVAARLGIYEMVITGNIPLEWRNRLITDFDKYAIPEHFLIGTESSKSITVPATDGHLVRLTLSDERISIRNFPEEFLTAKTIMLAPFGEEIDAEFVEWLASSSSAKIIWDPGLFRIHQGEAIPFSLERGELVRILKSIDLVSINVQESEPLVGVPDANVAAELLVEWGADTSIVTNGTAGSILYNGTDFIKVPAYPIKGSRKCWTGAAFVAGLTYGMIQDMDIVESAALASSIASIFIELPNRYSPIDVQAVIARQKDILASIQYK